MFKNRVFLEELLKKLLNDFAASRRKLLKNPFLSNFSCLKKTLHVNSPVLAGQPKSRDWSELPAR